MGKELYPEQHSVNNTKPKLLISKDITSDELISFLSYQGIIPVLVEDGLDMLLKLREVTPVLIILPATIKKIPWSQLIKVLSRKLPDITVITVKKGNEDTVTHAIDEEHKTSSQLKTLFTNEDLLIPLLKEIIPKLRSEGKFIHTGKGYKLPRERPKHLREDFQKKTKEGIAQSLDKIPSLPTVVMEIMRITSNEKSTVHDIEKHIRVDQGLTMRVLKLANSSYFGFSRKVKTINDAVVILGYDTLKSVVITAFSLGFFRKNVEIYGLTRKGLWEHSLGTAICAKEIVKRLWNDNTIAEELFVAGLLHDVGKLLSVDYLNKISDEFRQALETNKKYWEAEEMLLGINHAAIGGQIGNKWKLSQEINECIKFHHYPQKATTSPKWVWVINLANLIVWDMGIGLNEEAQANKPYCETDFETALDALKTPTELIDELKEACKEGYMNFSTILNSSTE